MALDFPNAPTDGQVYEGFAYSTAVGAWGVRDNTFSAAGVASAVNAGTATVGSDTVYTWTSSGTVTIATGGLADILVIGGGGSGGLNNGGGGGAGAMLYLQDVFIPSGTHDVIVGAGGTGFTAPGSYYGSQGRSGEPSKLGIYVAPGGGGGGGGPFLSGGTTQHYQDGGNGGSGGGGGLNKSGGKGISPYGNDGGSPAAAGGGGGGGAGAPGSGVNGGAGLSNSITGSAVTYAQGGQGRNATSGATTPTANTGNGGSGSHSLSGNVANAGSSGIVIVRIKG